MAYGHTVTLPNEAARARLLGKGGKKLHDIEMVSGAKLVISRLQVNIRAPSQISLALAIQLVYKSEKHRIAAARTNCEVPEPENVLERDLMLASYYTFKSD